MGLRSYGEPSIPPSADFTCNRASLYLDDLREALGAMLDVGVTVCGLSGQDIVDAFVVSGVAHEFERLNPAFVAGKSGIELVRLLAPFMGIAGDPLESAGVEYPFDRFGRSPDYWLGWSLGYFQVVTGLPYARVVRAVSYRELAALYRPLHEAPEEKFVSELCDLLGLGAGAAPSAASGSDSPLKLLRLRAGLTQAELAERSQTGLRSIQMYEQGHRDLAKARSLDVLRMAQALNCEVADLVAVG